MWLLPPKTNISPLKNDAWKTNYFPFETVHFLGNMLVLGRVYMGISKNRGKTTKIDGLSWKPLLKWMIWGAHPYRNFVVNIGTWRWQLFLALLFGVAVSQSMVLLLMAEIWLATWDIWNPKKDGINYLPTGAGFQPSTVGWVGWES